MGKIRGYEFTVFGKGQFPIDMMRYDVCVPKTEYDDVPKILSREEREVKMVSYIKPPTVGRWESFGWIVTNSVTF